MGLETRRAGAVAPAGEGPPKGGPHRVLLGGVGGRWGHKAGEDRAPVWSGTLAVGLHGLQDATDRGRYMAHRGVAQVSTLCSVDSGETERRMRQAVVCRCAQCEAGSLGC